MKKKIIGISGYMGSGKTEAGRILEKMGAYFIDADDVVNRLYEKDGAGYRKIRNFFGERFIKKDGTINRKKLGEFVFSDVCKLKILNGLIHPVVIAEIKNEMARVKERIIIIEAVYLDVMISDGILDGVVWIDCDENILIKRARKTGKYPEDRVKRIIGMQKKMNLKPQKPNFIVENNGNLKELEKSIAGIWKKLSAY